MPQYNVTVNPKRGGVPQGGITGQVLTKLSNNDWDSNWQTSSGGGATSFAGLTGTLALSQTTMSSGFILGRGTAGTGAFEQITLGTNLSLTGTTLNAAGGGGGSGGDPTQLIGLTPVNGSSVTFLRSDSAPAIDQSILPTWTGLHTFKLTDAVTNTTAIPLVVAHNSSGTPVANFGTKIQFQGKSDTTNDRTLGELITNWTVPADASRASRMVLRVVNSGSSLDPAVVFPTSGVSLGYNVLFTSVPDPGAGIVNANTGLKINNVTPASGIILKSDGSKFVASTETYAAPGTAGNVLRSDATNWLSAALTPTDVGLGNVTNNAQTQAAIVPNTAPTAGQILVGNAGNTAYAKQTVSGSGATLTLGATGVLTLSAIPNATLSNSAITIGGVSTSLGGSALSAVTNDTQTKAAIVPNTAPSAGQLLVGNAGGTAYAPVTVAGSGATITVASTGVHTISGIANASLTNSAITIAGTSTALGASITLDTIDNGISTVGLIKRTGANTRSIATAGTDYVATIPVSNTLYVDSAGGTGTRGRLDKPFPTIALALAAASSGDVVIVGPGTYASGTKVTIPAGVSLVGSGRDVTIITGTAGTAAALVVPGTGSLIANLTVDNSSSPTTSGGFIGCVAADTAFTSAVVSNCHLKGGIDGFYFDKAGVTGLVVYDCKIETFFDTIHHGATSFGTIELYNCDIASDGTSNPASRGPVTTTAGDIVRMFNGKIKVANSTGSNICAVCTGGTLELHNVRVDMTASGSTNLDLQRTAGTLGIDDVVRADGAAPVTSGTITELSRYLVRDNNLSDIVTPATARTNLGLAIGTNVQAWDTDLDTWATLTPSANFQTMVPHTFAQMRTDLGLVIGTNVQAWDTDLDALALSGANAAAQGTILYRGAANWTTLAPGTSGFFLKTQGAAADPIWAASAGSGTVTSITQVAPIVCTPNPITATGTIGLDVSVDHAFTAAQTMTLNDANTNSPSTLLTLSHDTTGTPANGIGTRLLFSAETSTTVDTGMAEVAAVWTDVTHATRTARLDIKALASSTMDTVASFFGSGISGGSMSVGSTTNPSANGIVNVATGFRVANAATSRKNLVGDGTNFVPSTETWAVPGTSGNVLTSDGTNWLSSAPAASGITRGQALQLAYAV